MEVSDHVMYTAPTDDEIDIREVPGKLVRFKCRLERRAKDGSFSLQVVNEDNLSIPYFLPQQWVTVEAIMSVEAFEKYQAERP